MKILERVANEKVEWKRLGEVAEILKGKQFNKRDMLAEGSFPVINGGISPSGYVEVFNSNENTITVSQGGASAGFINFIKTKFWLGAHAFSVIPIREVFEEYGYSYDSFNRYLYHILKMKQEELQASQQGAGIPSISKENLSNIQIPIPSLELQEEIVRILDTFTSYIDEITKERDLREKQYNYYRDMMLGEEYLRKIGEKYFLEKEYPLRYTTLGEVGKFTRGNGLQKKDFVESGYPVVHYGEIFTKYGFLATKTFSYTSHEIFSKLRKAKPKDILIATTSENEQDVGKCVVWEGDEEVGFSGDMYSFSTGENSRYIAYFFQTYVFQRQKERKISGTKLIRLHSDDMEKIKITLPPLIIQQKVVEVLDKFRELSDEVTGLLPLEIEQRQKQYEYYREKLLNFGTEFAQSIDQSINS